MLPGLAGIAGFSSSTASADAAIFALGLTAWWDASDLSTMFQDTAGATPVTAAGQPVGRINDKTGNGNHLLYVSSRPTLSSGSGLYWLVMSNVGTHFDCAGLTMTQPNDFVVGFSTGSTTFRFIFDGLTPTARNALITQSGAPRLYAGTATVAAGTIATSTATVLTTRFDGASSLIRKNGVSTSVAATPGAQGITGLRLGAAGADGSSALAGNFYGMLCRDNIFSAGELTTVEAYMAGKSGVTL